MEGLVGIYVSSIGNSCLANLGPGEILGDISFIGDIPASASVVAVENSHLLAISRTDLEAKLNEDPDFAARLYKTFAIISSKRLRERERTFGRMFDAKTDDGLKHTPVWERISCALGGLKSFFKEGDMELLKSSRQGRADSALFLTNVFLIYR
ncbi:MAG TPA: cyclic nucleotide-binding domain-containing protein [Spirochaetes bacterium]|nr:cyclic nucleotide-binding domain-containing protein [Spirochaetota bacterium]